MLVKKGVNMNSLVNRETGEVITNQVLSPVSLQLVVESFKAYQGACEALLTESDYQTIQEKQFKKKSAWRKLATAYCISTKIVAERRDEISSGAFVYHFTVRAEAGNGRYAEGVGSCSSDEKGLAKTEHNTRSIAETRATNRAISNLIGAGEVSAEEMTEESNPENTNSHGDKGITEKQRKRLFAIAQANKVPNEEVKKIILETYGKESTEDLSKAEYEEICDSILPRLGGK